ncbi:hypothetical protein IAD21_01371 [Abditibacteriota bacterium]|nr:hypothetical protein IAD21_01371 [Abditibacteriota bacterium]
MKSATKISLCLLLLAAPLRAQTPTDFAGWTARATELLNSPGEGENEIRRKWDQGTKATEAGKALMEAAKLAPDEATKFKTLDDAGAAFAKGNASRKEAAEAYGLARDVASIDPKERGRVGLEAATISGEVADYEKVVAIEGATNEQKAKAHAEIAVRDSIAKDNAGAADHYEIASRLDPTQANVWLGMASVNAQKITPATDAETMLDRVYKTWISWMESTKKTDDEIAGSRPYYLQNWARDLQAIGVSGRAITLWQEVGDNPKFSQPLRYDSLKNAATEAQKIKDYDKALLLWQKAGQINPTEYLRAQEVALGRSNAQLSKGDFAKSRDELSVLLTHPKVGNRDKEAILLAQSSLYFDEADALEKKNTPVAQVATSETAGIKVLNDVWAMPTSSEGALLQVVLAKVQRDLKKNKLTEAHEEVKTAISTFTARKFDVQWLQQLHILNGDVYRAEKQYENAMISYSTGIVQGDWNGTALVPNQAIYSAAISMLIEATDAKKFDEAHKVVDWLDKWRVPLDPTVLYKIELEVKAGNKEVARALITKNKPLIFQDDSKKKLAELETLANAN